MFDIGFSELVLIFIVGLVVLGPQRLPVAIRTVVGWIRTIRGIATNVQNELSQELKLHELQESIKKAEKLNLGDLSPELAKSIQDLKESAQKMERDVQEQQSNLDSLNKELQDGVKRIEDSLSADEQAELAEAGEAQLEIQDAQPESEAQIVQVKATTSDKISV